MKFPKSDVRYHVVSYPWTWASNPFTSRAEKSLQWHQGLVWSESESADYVEYMLTHRCVDDRFYFNQADYYATGEAPLVLIDGKQRLNAISKFVNNELEVFGGLFREFEELPNIGIEIIMTDIQTDYELIRWYSQLNYHRVGLDVIERMRIEGLLRETKEKK